MKTRVQVALVSDQAAPNLLPILDSAFTPDQVVLLVSKRMKERAQMLSEVIRESGRSIKVSEYELNSDDSFQSLQESLLSLAEELKDCDVAVNLTGGNKLMSLAAYSVADISDWSAFYLNIDTKHIVWLNDKRPPHPLSAKIGLNHYLRGYGVRLSKGIEKPADNSAWVRLTHYLITNARTLEKPVGYLNYLCQEAKKSLTYALTPRDLQDDNFQNLLDQFEQVGVLRVLSSGIEFVSEEALKFTNGGWIEQHVYQTVNHLPKELGIRDVGVNLNLVDLKNQPNELDVAFMANDRLYLLECKTMRMDDPDRPKANDTLYKIEENRRRLGGLGAKAMLVTYRGLRDAELRLAKALNVSVIQGHELERLEEKLKIWIKP